MAIPPKKEDSENFRILKGLYDQQYKRYWGETKNRRAKFATISNEEFEKRILENEDFAKEWGEFHPVTRALNPKIYQKITFHYTQTVLIMNQNQTLPTQSISLFFRSMESQDYHISSLITSDSNLVLDALDAPFKGLFIRITHWQLNTQLDLSRIAPAVILQFDEAQTFTGASLSLGTTAGSFGLVTQSKLLLILPFDAAFPIGQLTHFELN
jgi:hypothetical protein